VGTRKDSRSGGVGVLVPAGLGFSFRRCDGVGVSAKGGKMYGWFKSNMKSEMIPTVR
jgi:hypothetical protein